MKAVVLGGDGQVGAYFVRLLAENGWEVISPTHQKLDITDHHSTRTFIQHEQPDWIINTSAYHVLDECELYPEKAFDVNLVASVFLAKLSAELKARYVFLSTDYVFDGKSKRPYVETDSTNPLQIYGMSKAWAEQAVLYSCPDALVLRTASVFGGQGSRAKKGNFIVNLLKQSQTQKEIEVIANQYMSPTYAADLAHATFELLLKKEAGVFHVVNFGSCSWAEFAQKTIELTGGKTTVKPIIREVMKGQTLRPMYSALDISKLLSKEVVMPAWEEALKSYLTELKYI